MTEITTAEIKLSNCLLDEHADAKELVSRKMGTEYAEAIDKAAEDANARFLRGE